MNLPIPRGIICHHIIDDFKFFFKAFYVNLNNKKIISDFENSFMTLLKTNYCLAFPYARTAIYFSLKSLNLPNGSEIIMPPLTIKGILDVVLECGLKPVFVDIDINTLCFDEKILKSKINKRTRAIIITYLYGIVPDIQSISTLCKKSKLFIIEDFSQCLNGEFKSKKIGTFGDIGVYSSSSIKTLDTYGGGLLVCKQKKIFERLKKFKDNLPPPNRFHLLNKIATDLIRNIATNRYFFTIVTFPLLKIMNFIKPGSIIKQTGERNIDMIKKFPKEWLYSFSSLQAEIGLKYIKKLHHIDSLRILNSDYIKKNVKINFPLGTKQTKNVYWQLVAYFSNPIDAQKLLHKYRIDSARSSLLNISNLPTYPYRNLTPTANKLYSTGIFIPSFHTLSKSDINYLVKILRKVLHLIK